jgi:hypothetical protein
MSAITNQVLERWQAGDVIEVQQTMQEITLRVILETVFGLPAGPRQENIRTLLVGFLRDALNPAATVMGFLTQGEIECGGSCRSGWPRPSSEPGGSLRSSNGCPEPASFAACTNSTP